MKITVPGGLRWRLLLLSLLILLPALALIVFSYAEQRQQGVRSSRRESEIAFLRAAEKYEDLVAQTRLLLTVISKVPEIRERSPERCAALFRDLLQSYPAYANIGAAHRDGTVFASGLPMTGTTSVADRTYFRTALSARRFASGEYQVGRITGLPSINFGYPVVGSTGDVVAVVFAAIDVSRLARLIDLTSLPAGSILTLFDRQGTVLVRCPEGEPRAPSVTLDGAVARTTLIERQVGAIEVTGADGVARLHAYSALGGSSETGISVSLEIPLTAAEAQANRQLARNLILLAIAGILTFVVAWRGSDALVVREVRGLLATTKRIISGDLTDCVAPGRGRGEIGDLARAFDEMTEFLLEHMERRLEAEGVVRREQQKLESVVDNMSDGLVILDAELRFVRVNRTAARLLEWPGRGGDESRAFLEHVGASFQSHYPRDLAADLRAGQVQFELERPESERVRPLVLSCSASSIWDDTGALSCTVVVLRDVTALRNEEFQRESLLGVISHKLRSPLTVIQESLNLLREGLLGPLNGHQREMIERAAGQSEQFRQMVEKLIEFAGLSNRELRAPRDTIDLPGALPEMVSSVARELGLGAAAIRTEVAASGLRVSMNRRHLQLVLRNLIDNGVKFSDPERRHLLVRAQRRSRKVEIAVVDRGRGMPPEEIENVVAGFHQVEKWATGNPKGFGIGLAIVRRITAAHQGEIDLQSRLGHGTTVTVRLPEAAEPAHAALQMAA